MIRNTTGMDVFDRGFEPMCYCVSDSFNRNVENEWNSAGISNVKITKEVVNRVLFYAWHIRRSDLLTLGGR